MKTKRIHSMLAVLLLITMGCSLAGAADPNLVGWWKFDDGAGNIASDASGNNLEAILLGDPTWDTDDDHRGILLLDGTDDHLRIDGSTLELPLYTVAIWFRVDGGSGTRDILSAKGPPGVNGILLEIQGDGTMRYLHRFPFASGGGNNIYTTTAYADGTWHHVAAVKTPDEMQLYVDGEQVGVQADASQFEGPLGDVWIATLDQRMLRLLPGALDDVRFYNRPLTDAEIQAVMEGEPDPLAYGPEPGDGAIHDETWAILRWGAGDLAVSHNVYVGESLETVRDATPDNADVFRGSTTQALLRVGLPDSPYPEGLQRGTTYYWRVDEVNNENPDSPWKGPVWSFTVPPQTAWKPSPAQGAKFVDPNADLSWTIGLNALIHNVFFDTDPETVDGATTPKAMLADPTFDPGPLEMGTTYYWRVDEFDGIAWYKGDLWSFTVTTPGGGLKGEYYNNVDLAGDPVLTRIDPGIDFDFLDGSPEPNLVPVDNFSVRWVGELEIAFTETYTFHADTDNGVRLWIDDRLIIDEWSAFRRNEHPSRPIDLEAGQKYSFVMEFNEQAGPAAARLSWESPSQTKAVVPASAFSLPVRAIIPRPANGTTDVRHALALSWSPGEHAAQHDVYFGTDRDAVAEATTENAGVYRGRQDLDVTTFDPGPLEWNTTYYWRIDEVNDARPESPWRGLLWSFTTADFIVVDDFESYTGDVNNRIFQTWIDGMGYTEPAPGNPGNGTGSLVGTPDYPWVEMTIVHAGNQSMPLAYDNGFAPYYSETQRIWAEPRDWTVNNVEMLTLYYRGDPTNTEDGLYLAVEDAAGRVRVMAHPDPTALLAPGWRRWDVPLSDLADAGVDLTAIKVMYIGVGNRNAPAPGGFGQLHIDDIRVSRSASP